MICKYSIKQLTPSLKVETLSAERTIEKDKDICFIVIKKFIYPKHSEYVIHAGVGTGKADISHNPPVRECAHDHFQEMYFEAGAYYQDLFELKKEVPDED